MKVALGITVFCLFLLIILIVFQSRHYLTATRVSDWMTTCVYLSDEWTRSRPSEFSTFSCSAPREVDQITFPEKGTFAYRLRGEEKDHLVRLPA